MYYQISKELAECTLEVCQNGELPYVMVVTPSEWHAMKAQLPIELDMELDHDPHPITKAEVNYNSLTGSLSLPDKKLSDKKVIDEKRHFSTYIITENGIIFIDHDGFVGSIVNQIKETRKWKFPSLERFLYDFFAMILQDDLTILEGVEEQMDDIETRILSNADSVDSQEIYQIRSYLLDFRTYYEQFLTFMDELEDNESNLFAEENLHYFHLLGNRISRLQSVLQSLRDYSLQLMDLQKTQLDVKHNRITSILTTVTTIFFPLTLITGWYGMNFKYMPELELPMAYPIAIIVSACIVVGSIIYIKVKKWF